MTGGGRWGRAVVSDVKRAEGELPTPRGWYPAPRRMVSPGAIFRADLEDCPRHEIAADFGLTEDTTAQLLFRSPRSLRSALDARA